MIEGRGNHIRIRVLKYWKMKRIDILGTNYNSGVNDWDTPRFVIESKKINQNKCKES